MFFGTLTIANDGFSMVFGLPNHWFQWFSMVKDHWSNDGMVSMDRTGLPCMQHCCSCNHCGSDAESDQESANLNRRSIYFAILYEIARGEPCTTTATTVRWGALRSRRGQKEQTAKTQQCKMHFNKTQC